MIRPAGSSANPIADGTDEISKVGEVLYITRKCPPSIGGMQRLSFDLKESLAKVVPIHAICWGYSQWFLPAFLVYAFVRAIGLLTFNTQIKAIMIGDAVLAPLGWVLRRLYRKPVLAILHGRDLTYPSRLYQKTVLKCLGALDSFVCNSARTKREAMVHGLPEKRCHLVPIGINPNRYLPGSPGSSRDSSFLKDLDGLKADQNLILLTVGRLVRRKGVAWFLENVFAVLAMEFPQLRYLIVGDGPEKHAIRLAIRRCRLEGKVLLAGRLHEQDLHLAYRQADIFIMPNIAVSGDMEGFGIVALEAAVNQLCVVASRLEGIEDAVIDGGNGWLLTSGDAEAYKNKLRTLLDDKKLRESFAEQARRFTLSRFSWNTIATAYVQLLRHIVYGHDNCL